MSSSTYRPWCMKREMSSAQLEALKTPSSIGSPGAYGGVVELWISGGGGVGSFSNRPSSCPSYRTAANLLAQWKVSPGTAAEEKKRLCMKGRGDSLGLNVSHGDCPIAASEGHLGNMHWTLNKGADSWGAHNNVFLGTDAAVVALGEMWEECSGGGRGTCLLEVPTNT